MCLLLGTRQCAWQCLLPESRHVTCIDRRMLWGIEKCPVPNIDESCYFSLHTDEHTAEVHSGGLRVNLFQRDDCVIFALFPHIISQGLREFKCDLLGSDKSLTLWYLSMSSLYMTHFTTPTLILHGETLSLKGNLDFEKEVATSALKTATLKCHY